MAKIIIRASARRERHFRTRRKIVGTPLRPRLSIYRSEKNIFAQIVDDTQGVTLGAASTVAKDFQSKGQERLKPIAAAALVGKLLATKAKEKNIEKVVFDKSGYQYHGRVKALAEGAREGGLKF